MQQPRPFAYAYVLLYTTLFSIARHGTALTFLYCRESSLVSQLFFHKLGGLHCPSSRRPRKRESSLASSISMYGKVCSNLDPLFRYCYVHYSKLFWVALHYVEERVRLLASSISIHTDHLVANAKTERCNIDSYYHAHHRDKGIGIWETRILTHLESRSIFHFGVDITFLHSVCTVTYSPWNASSLHALDCMTC
jgi:hypothetical protein